MMTRSSPSRFFATFLYDQARYIPTNFANLITLSIVWLYMVTFLDKPKLSVIIPVYNREIFLERAIQSVLRKEERNVEILVIDDGSSDGSYVKARQFLPHIKIFQQRHQGANVARNLGLQQAKGKFIRFLDSDDVLIPDFNTKQLDVIEKQGADVCYGNWSDAKIDENGVFHHDNAIQSMGNTDDFLGTLIGDQWCAPFCYIVRRSIALDIGGWDETLDACQDFDFFLRVSFRTNNTVYFPEVIGYYCHHSGERVSRKNLKKWCYSKLYVLNLGSDWITKQIKWDIKRRQNIATSYLHLAKIFIRFDRVAFRICIERLQKICPVYNPDPPFYRMLVCCMGYEKTERLCEWRRKIHQTFSQ